MSRSGYTEDADNDWQLICWRGAVASAIRGKRGQKFLREMLVALDAMPTQRLIARKIDTLEGCCAIGAVARQRQVDATDIDPEDSQTIAARFGVAHALVCEIMFENDDGAGYWSNETPSQRWRRMRHWIETQIVEVSDG
jgi:hypothetical protein